MRNSAINKSNKNTFPNPKVQSGPQISQKTYLQTTSQNNNEEVRKKHQASFKGLFKLFRDSVEANQSSQNQQEQQSSKPISFAQKSGTPLFKEPKRQENYIEASDFDKGSHEQNDIKPTNVALQEFDNRPLANDQLQVQSRKQLKSRQPMNQQLLAEPQNEPSFEFGLGLQGIDCQQQQQGPTPTPTSHQDTGMFATTRNRNKSIQHVLSTFTPTPSNLSANKKSLRVSYAEMRSTGRNFFKRSSSLTHSQECLKTIGSDLCKADKKDPRSVLNSSVTPFRQNEFKGVVVQNKRPSSQIRNSTKHSFIGIPHIHQGTPTNRHKPDGNYLSLANSLSRILFKYNGGHATTLYNYGLKIKNESPVRLSVKIKCTNPRNYEVRPSPDATLNPGEIFSVSIEMKLLTHDLNHTTMKHDLTRYKTDKFKILYWTPDHLTEEQYRQGEKVLPVVIQLTEEEKLRNEGLAKNLNFEKIKQATQEKEIQMYKKFIEKNRIKSEEITQKIKALESHEFRHKYFSKHLFLHFAIVGIAIGFWIG